MLRHLLLVSLIASGTALSAATNNNPWGTIWTGDGKFYLLNNTYSWPSGATLSGFLNSQNDWGGNLYFNGTQGGAAIQLNYGKWPWSNDTTTGSLLPKQIQSNPNMRSNMTFALNGVTSKTWNVFWELWTHSSSSISGSNITCDLMIHPQYDSTAGLTWKYQRTFDNVTYGVYLQPADSWRPYPIVHYYRSTKATTVPTVRFDNFLWDCVGSGWAKSGDWLGSITAGIENTKDAAGIRVSSYNVWKG